MIEMRSSRILKLCRTGILAIFILTLAGCAATGSRIQGYEGPELPDTQTATLQAPATIKVISINGTDTTSFLLEDLALNYGLKPGSNAVVFKYRSIWSKNTGREDGESAVDVVESAPVVAAFDARAGQTYTFADTEADNVREARRIAQNFNTSIVTGSGRTVTRAQPYSGQQQKVAATLQQPAESTGASTAPVAPDVQSGGVAAGMSTLDALNLLWQRASREEKEAFLRRAFESQP